MCIIKIRCSANFNTNESIEAELRRLCKHRKISENGFLGSNFDRGGGDGENFILQSKSKKQRRAENTVPSCGVSSNLLDSLWGLGISIIHNVIHMVA